MFFTAPTLGFIPTLGYHGSILISPKTLALPAEEQADLSNDIGSGPFVVESWKEGDSVVLEKREDYDWGPAALDHPARPTSTSITYKLVAEPSVRTAAVQSGQADVAYNPSPQELESFKDQGFTVATPRYLGFVNGYAINTGAPFDDINVRQALQHGIDREEILATVYTEDWSPPRRFIQSNVPEATDHSDAFAYDPDQAKKLLDEAGWAKGRDGVRAKDGKPLELTLYPNPYLATSKAVDELIAQQLARSASRSTSGVRRRRLRREGHGNPACRPTEVTRSFIDVGTVAGVLTEPEQGRELVQPRDERQEAQRARHRDRQRPPTGRAGDGRSTSSRSMCSSRATSSRSRRSCSASTCSRPDPGRDLQRHGLRELLHRLDAQ